MIDSETFNEVVGESGSDFPLLHQDFDPVAEAVVKNHRVTIILWGIGMHCLVDRQVDKMTAGDMTAMRSALVTGFLIGRNYEDLAAIKRCAASSEV